MDILQSHTVPLAVAISFIFGLLAREFVEDASYGFRAMDDYCFMLIPLYGAIIGLVMLVLWAYERRRVIIASCLSIIVIFGFLFTLAEGELQKYQNYELKIFAVLAIIGLIVCPIIAKHLITDREVYGDRIECSQTLWLPLCAFLIAEHIHLLNLPVAFIEIFIFSLLLCLAQFGNDNIRATVGTSAGVITLIWFGGPNTSRRTILPYIELDTAEDAILYYDPWKEKLIAAALIYIVSLNLFCKQERLNGLTTTVTVMHVLMVCAHLWIGAGYGTIDMNGLAIFCKAVALATSVFCLPHFFYDISPRRSKLLLSFFVVGVIPLVFGAFGVLIKNEIASNDILTKTMDYCKQPIGVVYLMIFILEGLAK